MRFGCELRGDPDARVDRAGSLQSGPGALGFVASRAWLPSLQATRNTAVVIEPRFAAQCPVSALVHRNPHATFARIASELHPEEAPPAGIAATARVAADASIGAGASIGEYCIVESGAELGRGVVLGPHCIVGRDVRLGDGTRLAARVTIAHGVTLGPRCIVHPGAVVGSDGFGNAREGEGWVKVPQLGGVRIGADVEIGANTTIDRGALDDTVIEDGVKLDNQIQIAHNVVIGAHTAIAACTGIAGSADIGAHCTIGGAAMILGHLKIADRVSISAASVVMRSIAKPGLYSGVFPIDDNAAWEKNAATLRQLHGLRDRLRILEKRAAGEAMP